MADKAAKSDTEEALPPKRGDSGVCAITPSPEREREPADPHVVKLRLLVVDDDPVVARMVDRNLGKHGLHVRGCTTAAEALRPGVADAHDVVLLDVNLENESGLDACRALRDAGYDGGIIMLSGVIVADIKASALFAGADDYVTKPVESRELLARIQAVARRCSRRPLLEIRGRAVRVRGVPVTLSRTERQILLVIHGAGARGVPRDDLLALISAADPYNALNVYISRLRKKLGAAHDCLHLADGRYWLDAG